MELINGIVSTGCNVIDLGMVPTPVLYFSCTKYGTAFGAMVTASHLPGQYNGVKFTWGNLTLSADELTEIENNVRDESFVSGKGTIETNLTIENDYIEFVINSVSIHHKFNCIIDGQNGASSEIVKKIFPQIVNVQEFIHCDVNQPYPFLRPDPQIETNLQPLKRSVLEKHADIGLAFDGDGDRVGVIDNLGNFVPIDYVLALFARGILATTDGKGARVVYDVLTSQTLRDEILRNDGIPVEHKSGHAFIKSKMNLEKALLAGESSGHIAFADRYFGYDDGIYAACRLLELIDQSKQSLAELIASLPAYILSEEERPDCADSKKHQVIETLRAEIEDAGYKVSIIDGVKIYFPSGWGLVRASNTESVLSIRAEASNTPDLESYLDIIWAYILKSAQLNGVEIKRKAI